MALREQQQRMRAEQKLAQEQAKRQTQEGNPVGDHQYSILEIALINDVNKTRSMPTLADKATYKRDHFLPKWLPYAKDYFKKGTFFQNDIVGYCIVYSFDAGEITQALEMAQQAINDGQRLPERFKSSIATFTANQIFEFTEKNASAGESVEPYFSQTFQKIATEWKLHEKVQAKWYKLAGNLLITTNGKTHPASNNDPERLTLAISLFNRAFQLDHRVGVTNVIERCTMRLKKLKTIGIKTESQPVGGITLDKTEINLSRIIELLNAPPLSIEEIKEKYAVIPEKQEQQC